MVKDILKELGLEEKSFPPREVQSVISRAKNDMQSPEEFLEQWQSINDWRKMRMGKVYTLYNKKLREANALDFDDLLWHTVRLLQTAPDVREYYQRKFRYVLIDEYQDTNEVQNAIFRAVSREGYSVHSFFGFGHISPLRDSCLTNITSYYIPILVSTRMYFISHLGSKIDMRKVAVSYTHLTLPTIA